MAIKFNNNKLINIYHANSIYRIEIHIITD